MATGSSLLAMAVTAAVGAGPGDEPISCQVRVLTMDGLGWRSTYYPRLQPVARQGTSSVWTADRALAETMTTRALAATVAPVCTNPGETTVEVLANTCYVSHMERLADGPKDHATAVAFRPETATVVEGFRAGVSGRKLDQGVLARVSLEESHVKALHAVRVSESFAPTDRPRPAPDASPKEIVGEFLRVVEEKTFGKADPRIGCQIQVPETSHAIVEGEWLVPNDGILLISLGVETVADEHGMAVVRERVAVIEVAPASKTPALSGTSFEPPTFPHSMPPVPGRSLPVPIDPQGRTVDLPPLPVGLASAGLDQIPPDPNQPSPQALQTLAPSADPRFARTEFHPVPVGVIPAGPFARGAMPAVPARSIPVGLTPEGEVVDLPPLPESLASADLNQVQPNQPSPQALVPTSIVDPALARTAFVEKSSAPSPIAGCELRETPPSDASLWQSLISSLADSRINAEIEWDIWNCKITLRAGISRGDEPPAAEAATPAEAVLRSTAVAAEQMALIAKILGALAESPAPMVPIILPSGKYFHDDVQYFAPGPDFPSANTQATTQRARIESSLPHAQPDTGSESKAPAKLAPEIKAIASPAPAGEPSPK